MMREVSRLGLVGLSTVALLGCGGGGPGNGPSVPTATVDSTGAAEVTDQTSTMVAAIQAQDGTSVTNSVMFLALDGPQTMLVPDQASPIAKISRAVSEPGPSGGSVDCTASGCVYNHYADSSSGYGSFEIDGSVNVTTTGDTTTVSVDMSISMDLSDSGTTINETYNISGSLTVSPAMIDGALTTTGSGHYASGGQSASFSYFEQIKFMMVTLAADGTPNGGSIYAKWAVSAGGQSQGYQGTITY
jgi:hypothetical protein